MKNATVAQLRKYLKNLDEKELENIIVNLFKSNKDVKNQLSFEILGNEYGRELLEEYKKKATREFDKRTTRFSLRTLNGYLSSFKKEVQNDDELVVQLLFLYTNNMLDFLSEFGWDESVENSFIRSFLEAIEIVSKDESLYKIWEEDIKSIFNNSYISENDLTYKFVEKCYSIPWLSNDEREDLRDFHRWS